MICEYSSVVISIIVRLLLQTFRSSLLRGLKDAFPPCRTATLMAIKVAVSSDAKNVFSREELMTRFAPIICHRCVDADTNVQLAAFSVLEHILNFTKTEAMPEPPHQTTAHGAVVLPVSASVPVSSTTRSPVRCSPSSAFSTKTHQGGATNIEFYATANYDATIASNCGALVRQLGCNVAPYLLINVVAFCGDVAFGSPSCLSQKNRVSWNPETLQQQ